MIYAGHETKLILHQSTDSNKETTLDRILNSQIKTIFIFIFLLSILCATCCTWWTKKNLKKHWYLQLQGNKMILLVFISNNNNLTIIYVKLKK